MSNRYSEIAACRICGNSRLESVLHLGTQALTGVFPRTPAEQDQLNRGPLELVKCHGAPGDGSCGLLQLRQSYPAQEMYGTTYGYRSALNRSMVEHLQAKARDACDRVALQPGDFVLDIGSNDGTLLAAYENRSVNLVGIDPSAARFARYYPPHVRLEVDFFSASAFRRISGGHGARIVTSIAMFYDLDNPMEFVTQVRDILEDDGVWILEQSYMPEMLRVGAYDTVCHEHVEYYGLGQIKWMFDRAGLKILTVDKNAVNGGSFCVTAARASAPYVADHRAIDAMLAAENAAGLGGLQPYEQFRRRTERHRGELTALLHAINGRGQRIVGYGASTKGNVVLQYCGLTPTDLLCIAEVNEDKFGAYTPGTAIPIVSEAQARAMKPDYQLVLPWHFRENILQREQSYLRAGGKLVFPLPEIEIVDADKSRPA